MTQNKSDLTLKNKPRLSTQLLQKILFPSRIMSNKDKQHLAEIISNKTILITGASYGIGEQLAYLLSRLESWQSISDTHSMTLNAKLLPPNLILVGRTTEKLEEVLDYAQQTGCLATIYSVDLREEEQRNEFIQYLQTQSVDVFVNNAGKSIKRPLMQSLDRLHDFERTINLNYLAPVELSLNLIPQLKSNCGQIINVSALNVLLPPMPEWAAYQASKTAFDQWLRSASPELKANGIHTSTLYLPLVRTRMIAPTKMYQYAPAMTPEQVASLIGKLMISKKSRFKPWWLYPVEVLSVLFRYPLELFIRILYRHKYIKKNRDI